MSNVKNQMSNVNKVKLLSERTSGVPPVIFWHGNVENRRKKYGKLLKNIEEMPDKYEVKRSSWQQSG